MPVYRILDEMPASELYGWVDFYADKSDRAELEEQRQRGNLMVMDESEILAKVGVR